MKNQKTILSAAAMLTIMAVLSPAASGGVIVALKGGYYMPNGWADSHDAVYGGSGMVAFGIEAGYTFEFPLEIALGIDFIPEEGNRIWPDGQGGWESTGESISSDLMPVTLVARWRFMRERTFSPYTGAGIGYVQFKETRENAKKGSGLVLQGGGDFYLTKLVKLFVELEYTSFPDIIGDAGASRYFGENDLGGITTRLGARFTF
ncbi:outer membrane beta-barrel protein [bacterium]|nr:outer membrane beta-barrel protein [candidate division CSSED10-310 bacterium]